MQDNELQKARAYAYRLFKFRQRIEFELVSRLKKRGISPDVIEKIIKEFKEQGLIDDKKFIQDWINARRQKGLGSRRIEFELRQKGIPSQLLEENTDLRRDEYSLVLEIAKRQKDNLLRKGVGQDKLKSRLFNFMARRGFEINDIKEIIEEIF